MDWIRRTLLYAGLERAEMEALLPEAREENGRYVRAYTLIGMIAFAVCALATLVMPASIAVNRPVYLIMVGANTLLYLLARAILPRRPDLSTLLANAFIIALYAYAISVSLLHPDGSAVAPVAVLLVMPSLFNYRPVYMILMTLTAGTAHCLLARGIKAPGTLALDAWNLALFGGVAMLLSGYQMRVKFRLLLQKRQNRRLSETDILTGARNRNCFERARAGYAERCRERLTCVFIDANGLHELNDTRGHEVGDALLRTVARAAIGRFGEAHTYRIGGDEFVVFCPDTPIPEVQDGIRGVIAEVSAAGYSVSVGAACHDRAELDIHALVKQAEHYMYKEKRKYYEQGGHDRRRRVFNETPKKGE